MKNNTTNHEINFANIQYESMEVNPGMARYWLANRSPEARKTYEKVVKKYAADMKCGCWKFDCDPIVFGSDGKLYRGVQRIAAIVESGTSQKFMIVHNCPTGMSHSDMGVRRSAAVNISHAYYNDLAWVNSMTTATMNFVHAVFPDAVYRDNDEYASYIRTCQDDIQHVEAMLRGSESGLNRAFVRAAITLALVSGADKDLVDEMCRVLKDGAYNSSKRVANKNFHELRNYIKAREVSMDNTHKLRVGLFMAVANVLKATEKKKAVGMLDESWENMDFPYNVFTDKGECVYQPIKIATKKLKTKKNATTKRA